MIAAFHPSILQWRLYFISDILWKLPLILVENCWRGKLWNEKAISWFSSGNRVNHFCWLQLESNKDQVSCFASSKPLLPRQIFFRAVSMEEKRPLAAHCIALPTRPLLGGQLNAHNILFFEGRRQISDVIKYLWDMTANVMLQCANSSRRPAIHSDFKHLIPGVNLRALWTEKWLLRTKWLTTEPPSGSFAGIDHTLRKVNKNTNSET